MSKLRVQSFGISIDGYRAGPNQDLRHPLGVRGPWPDELSDSLHLAMRPVLLGSGGHLLGGIDLRALGYECAECR